MTSILIARLPPHPKSPKAVEFMQENGFFFRITSNSPLANLLMSSGEVEDCVAQMMGFCEEFKPEKEEIEIVKELMKTQVNGNLQERGDFIDQPENKDKQPVEQEKNVMEPVKVKDEEDSDGMEGVFETTTEEPPQENVAVIIQPPITDSLVAQTLSAAVHSKYSEEISQKQDSQQPSAMDDSDEGELGDEHLGSVDADDFTMSLHPRNDDSLGFDDEDLLEHKAAEHNDGVEDEEQMDESSDGEDVGDSGDEENRDVDEECKKKDQPSGNPAPRLLFTCPLKNCHSCYKMFKDLEKHTTIHSDMEDLVCDVCKKKFSSKEEAMVHIEEREKKECCVCGKKLSAPCRLVEHHRSHSEEKPFVCKTCGKQFAQFRILTNHTLTHTGEKLFKCGHCTYASARKADLIRHCRIHTGEKPYSCGLCEKRFSVKSNLKTHELTHSGEKHFECNHCGRRFTQRSTLTAHIRLHTGQKPFSCSKCNSKFTHNGNLRVHMKRIHHS